MKHKVSELEGALLDAAVAKALGRAYWISGGEGVREKFAPSSRWGDGGPLIYEFRITWAWQRPHSKTDAVCIARCERWDHTGITVQTIATVGGRDPLVASMRALVASHFGEEVEL